MALYIAYHREKGPDLGGTIHSMKLWHLCVALSLLMDLNIRSIHPHVNFRFSLLKAVLSPAILGFLIFACYGALAPRAPF